MTVALQGRLEAHRGRENSLTLCSSGFCLTLNIEQQEDLLEYMLSNLTKAGKVKRVTAGPTEGEDR